MIIENLAPRDEESAHYKMREGRRLVGFALKHHPDPAVFYGDIEQPPLKELATVAERKIAAEYTNTTGEISGAIDVLLWGMSDVSRLVAGALKYHRSVTREQALAITANPGTLMSHAHGARIPQEQSDEYLFSRPGDAYDLSQDHSHIAIIDKTLAPHQQRGCAAVTIENGIPIGDPLFNRFASWSGQLAVEAYFHHLREPSPDELLF